MQQDVGWDCIHPMDLCIYWAWETQFQRGCSHVWQVGVGYWWETSFLLHDSLFTGWLNVLMTWQLDIPREWSKKSRWKKSHTVYSTISSLSSVTFSVRTSLTSWIFNCNLTVIFAPYSLSLLFIDFWLHISSSNVAEVSLLIVSLSVSPQWNMKSVKRGTWFSSFLYPQCWEDCLAHSEN